MEDTLIVPRLAKTSSGEMGGFRANACVFSGLLRDLCGWRDWPQALPVCVSNVAMGRVLRFYHVLQRKLAGPAANHATCENQRTARETTLRLPCGRFLCGGAGRFSPGPSSRDRVFRGRRPWYRRRRFRRGGGRRWPCDGGVACRGRGVSWPRRGRQGFRAG